jgi:hypothetical protein
MNAPRRLKVYILLGPPDEPIRGELEAPSGELSAFSGWIGLVAAIEAARMPTPVEGQPIAGGEAKPETASAPRRTGQWSRSGARDMNQMLDR